MQFRKIKKIKDFGVFRNFGWKTDLQEFSNFNIFYGWNYSGKTTLSRIFRCFETQTNHPDYFSSKFDIEDECSGIHNQSLLNGTLSVRVFNSDYIVDNLKRYAQDDDIPPILLLGQESIELTKELEIEKSNLKTVKQKRENTIKDKSSKIALMNQSLTTKAREIKESLVLTNFTKAHFEPKVKTVSNESFQAVKLNDKAVNSLKDTYRSTEKKNLINNISFSVPNINLLNAEIVKLFNTTVESKVIEKLKNNQELNDWVKTGKHIHKNKDLCEFCGNKIPGDLIQKLNEHFSNEYEELLQAIDSQIRKIRDLKIVLNLPDSANLYGQFQNKYLEEVKILKGKVEEVNEYLKNIFEQLKTKKQKPFEKIDFENLQNDFDELDGAKLKVNNVINLNNQKTSDFENDKNQARERLIEHYAQTFAETNKFAKYELELSKIEEIVVGFDKEESLIENKILAYEKKLSDIVKGAEKINEHLFQYFGKNDIKVTVNSDEKFQLTRASEIAKNLSEGEKTAIAFAYFVASLENKDTKLSETIVFIDDPISSLDSNHLFNTYSFVKNVFYDYKRDPITNERKHQCKAAQLFISTHNFEFLNLIKQWLEKVKKVDKSFYLIERINKDINRESIIKELPIELLKFKSEYVYLFSVIYEFYNSLEMDFRLLYNLPNIVRRFVESFCAFKHLSTVSIDENLDLFIKDNIKRERVRKFVHYYSHSLSSKTIMEFSDATESREVIETVLNSLKLSDEEHYNSLIKQVSPST